MSKWQFKTNYYSVNLKCFKSTTTQHIISKLKSLKPTNQLLLSNMKSFK